MAIDRRDFRAFNNQQIQQLIDAFGAAGKLASETQTLSNKTFSDAITASGGVTGNVTGNVTGEVTALGSAETAEHGAGAIGTGTAPVTYRYNAANGDIITEIQIDVTGLQSKDTANDVIGLVTDAPDAYLGQVTAAVWGVLYKMELICLEAPAGGDDDINVIFNSTGTLGYDDAGGTTGLDAGVLAIGESVVDLSPGVTEDDYVYLTAGTGDTDVEYSAGQYIIRFYGHAVLS
ncbi:MAG: hypothetical protein ACYTFK_13485 [Planctomycetota bacterium]|jgi:hypothetical protein